MNASDRSERLEVLEEALRIAEEQTVAAHDKARLQDLPILQERRVVLPAYSALVRDFDGLGKPPLVLIHGLGTDWRLWLDMVGALSERHRVLIVELRLHGDAAGAPPALVMDDLADDIAATLDALGIDRAVIAGLSMGGAVAQHFALRHAKRLDELWLIATLARGFPALLDRAAAAESSGVESQVATTLLRWFTPATLAANGPCVRYARSTIRRLSVEQWAGSWRVLATVDALAGLPRIEVPVHVVAGEMDLSTTPEMMRGIAALVPSAAFSVVPGAAHMIPLEAPRLLSRILLSTPSGS
jgi:3-oxoadipate enol-lactonase